MNRNKQSWEFLILPGREVACKLLNGPQIWEKRPTVVSEILVVVYCEISIKTDDDDDDDIPYVFPGG